MLKMRRVAAPVLSFEYLSADTDSQVKHRVRQSFVSSGLEKSITEYAIRLRCSV